ncbi:hypothetical protein AB3S75_010572 [Citrus x aurantiifolia]
MASVAMASQCEEKEEKWIKHYSSNHQILLVGEGDFSFSLCLALAFGSASNICASSLDSYDDVIQKYKRAKSNLDNLKKLGACILHGVDATTMELHPDLRTRKFDRIIFNFPHAGFYGKEDNHLVIEMHRSLVRDFFRNSSGMLRDGGEVHVSHKTTVPFSNWNIKELAIGSSLSLIWCSEFKIEDYPTYNNKRGDGPRCDEPFPLGECSTFIFGFLPAGNKKSGGMSCNEYTGKRSRPLQEIPFQVLNLENPLYSRYPHTNSTTSFLNIQRKRPKIVDGYFNSVREDFGRAGNCVGCSIHEFPRFDISEHSQTRLIGLPLFSDFPGGHYRIYDDCSNNANDTLKRFENNVGYPLGESLISYERYMVEAPGRTLNSYIYLIDQLIRFRRLGLDSSYLLL